MKKSMSDSFDIKPYWGAGPLRLGMSRKQVEAVLGPPDKTRSTTFFNETIEFRCESALQTVYSAEGALVEISFGRAVEGVTINDLDVFKTPGREVIERLVKADGRPLEIVGIIVFLNLGISMTGFLQDDEPGQKAIGVFAKGRFDTKLEKMRPYKLKKNRSQ